MNEEDEIKTKRRVTYTRYVLMDRSQTIIHFLGQFSVWFRVVEYFGNNFERDKHGFHKIVSRNDLSDRSELSSTCTRTGKCRKFDFRAASTELPKITLFVRIICQLIRKDNRARGQIWSLKPTRQNQGNRLRENLGKIDVFTHLDRDAAQRFAVGGHVKEHFWQRHFFGRRFWFRGIRQKRCESTGVRVPGSGAELELPAGEQAKRGGRH